jgi:hypothetical protein
VTEKSTWWGHREELPEKIVEEIQREADEKLLT